MIDVSQISTVDIATSIIVLNENGVKLARFLTENIVASDCWLQQSIVAQPELPRFQRFFDLFATLFPQRRNFICIMPTGIVVRGLATLAKHKLTDPAVVVLDVCGRWAISLLSGHEGGANQLAYQVANLCGAEPIVTTTTEANRKLVAGVGCRRGIDSVAIVSAIDLALDMIKRERKDIRLLATAMIKKNETGLLQATEQLQIPLRFFDHDLINRCLQVKVSIPALQHLQLRAVAEPCALLAASRGKLILEKICHRGVTIALVEEDCW